jgi:hypothetical protein
MTRSTRSTSAQAGTIHPDINEGLSALEFGNPRWLPITILGDQLSFALGIGGGIRAQES